MKKPKLTGPLLQIRTNIALDCARHKYDDAIGGWQKGADFIEHLPATPIKGTLQDSWREWGDEIRDRKKSRQLALTAELRWLAVLVQQHALGLLRVHRTVEQLVVFEEDLDKRRTRGDRTLNQRL